MIKKFIQPKNYSLDSILKNFDLKKVHFVIQRDPINKVKIFPKLKKYQLTFEKIIDLMQLYLIRQMFVKQLLFVNLLSYTTIIKEKINMQIGHDVKKIFHLSPNVVIGGNSSIGILLLNWSIN